MLDLIEERFAASGRTPKGRKARLAIYRATRDIVGRRGIEAASLDAIADRAGLTQAAVRHYFGTRDELVTAFFVAATGWFREQVTGLLNVSGVPAREQLKQYLSWHLEYMENVDTAVWLEASAYWLRQRHPRRTRDDWYRWLVRQYARLIAEIRPTLGARECQRRAYVLLTLVLGAWITHGRGSAVSGAGGAAEQRRLLVDAALRFVTDGH